MFILNGSSYGNMRTFSIISFPSARNIKNIWFYIRLYICSNALLVKRSLTHVAMKYNTYAQTASFQLSTHTKGLLQSTGLQFVRERHFLSTLRAVVACPHWVPFIAGGSGSGLPSNRMSSIHPAQNYDGKNTNQKIFNHSYTYFQPNIHNYLFGNQKARRTSSHLYTRLCRRRIHLPACQP